jgi:hypothetical protein
MKNEFEEEPIGSRKFEEAPEHWSTWEKKICSHCGYPIGYANPSGVCSHIYYPDNCIICKNGGHTDFISEEELDI